MGNFRKFISLLLVFVLVLSLCPAGFAAEDVDGAEILEEAELTEPDIIETEPAEPGGDGVGGTSARTGRTRGSDRGTE